MYLSMTVQGQVGLCESAVHIHSVWFSKWMLFVISSREGEGKILLLRNGACSTSSGIFGKGRISPNSWSLFALAEASEVWASRPHRVDPIK